MLKSKANTFVRRWAKVRKLRENLSSAKRSGMERLEQWREEYGRAAVRLERIKMENNIAIERAASILKDAETKLRDEMLLHFRVSGEKKFPEGMEVKQYVTFQYDPKEALQWATEHRLCLELDKGAFEKLVRLRPDDFKELVTIGYTPKAQLPT